MMHGMEIIRYLKKHPELSIRMSALWSLVYGVFNLSLSLTRKSYWYLAIGAYFLILGTGRLTAAAVKGKLKTKLRMTAGMILFLAAVIAGLMYMTIHEVVYPEGNRMIVIGQAAFVFTMLGAAVYNMILSIRRKDRTVIMARNLSMTAAVGAVLSLQRTMLGTFGNAADTFNIQIGAYTGAGAVIILFLLAYDLLRESKKKIGESE